MICSELELGLGEAHEGVLFLPDDAPVGGMLKDYLGDAVLEFDIKGGFAHLLSIYGLARETAAITRVMAAVSLASPYIESKCAKPPLMSNSRTASPK